MNLKQSYYLQDGSLGVVSYSWFPVIYQHEREKEYQFSFVSVIIECDSYVYNESYFWKIGWLRLKCNYFEHADEN